MKPKIIIIINEYTEKKKKKRVKTNPTWLPKNKE